jgi:hypothetical protein
MFSLQTLSLVATAAAKKNSSTATIEFATERGHSAMLTPGGKLEPYSIRIRRLPPPHDASTVDACKSVIGIEGARIVSAYYEIADEADPPVHELDGVRLNRYNRG